MTKKRSLALFILAFGLQTLSIAQPSDETFGFDAPESWAMKYFASVGILNGYGPQDRLKPGKFQLRGELANIPHLSLAERTVGFGGTKEENLNKAPILFRPTATVGITNTFSASLSWVPPIEVFDRLETNMLAASLNLRFLEKKDYVFGARVYAQHGTAKGDFTCAEEWIGAPPEQNPFDCNAPSNDRFISDTYGLELSFAKQLTFLKNTTFFVGVSFQEMDLEFQVRAERSGFQDMRSLFTEGSTHSYTMGLRKQVKDNLFLSGSIFYSPLDVRRSSGASLQNDELLNFRFALDYNL